MKMTGSTILITGGTSGIGLALALAFQQCGNSVIITGRRQRLLDEIIASQPSLNGMLLDVDDPKSVQQFGGEIRERFPELNILVANAGISRTEDLTADSWKADDAQAIVETNILGVLRVTEVALPIIKRNANAAIIVTGSALAFVPRADFPTYSASKAFLHSWLQSLRHRLRSVPVEVLELAPPYVRTAITGPQQASDPRAMPVDDYVAEVMKLLGSENYPRGEILLERDHARRWAERDGRYDAVFAALNPS